MSFSIRYLVPYMATIKGLDVASGKPVSNIHYLRCGLQTVSPPTYGAPIPGPSSTATLLTSLEVNWLSHIVPRLNVNYQYQSTQMVALIGKRYGTPINSIFSLATGAPCVLSSPVPHGLQTNDQVLITSQRRSSLSAVQTSPGCGVPTVRGKKQVVHLSGSRPTWSNITERGSRGV
jgi:hypothetical protein